MIRDIQLHDRLARLLRYPGEGGAPATQALIADLTTLLPGAGEFLGQLQVFCAAHRSEDLEEIYTQNFDNTAEQSLDVGWQLYGENYTRGAFLVAMRGRLRDCGVPENGELPDHITHVLPVLARTDEKTARLLAIEVALPAITKVRDALRASSSPYVGVLELVLKVLVSYRTTPETANA